VGVGVVWCGWLFLNIPFGRDRILEEDIRDALNGHGATITLVTCTGDNLTSGRHGLSSYARVGV